MFFRRSVPVPPAFSELLERARAAGCSVESGEGGQTCISRGGLAAVVEDAGPGQARLVASGLLIGGEVAKLTDQGYQKIFRTAHGKTAAAQAGHLKALHAFLEDLRELLGQTSLYNQALGSTNELHLYDRVRSRDTGVGPLPWQR